jgi:hypothetical protein
MSRLKYWSRLGLERCFAKDKKRWQPPRLRRPKPVRTGKIEAVYYDAYGQKVGEDRGEEQL